jgi:hypothetical protein
VSPESLLSTRSGGLFKGGEQREKKRAGCDDNGSAAVRLAD